MTNAQHGKIAHVRPAQRDNVTLSNIEILNAILYAAEHG